MTAGMVGSATKSSPIADPRSRMAAGVLGLRLFLLSLGIFFAAVLIGYAVLRLSPALESTIEIPPLPRALWLSTLFLLASSGTIHLALTGVRREKPRWLRGGMVATAILGIAFLAMQTLCWISWAGHLRSSLAETQRAFLVTSFYVFTGLHAIHVIGGLVPLTVVTRRAFGDRYTSADHAGVRYCTMYWHFLDVVWLVLFATLLVAA